MNEKIDNLFEEYGNTIRVSDFGILFRGALVDYITLEDDSKVHLYGGDPQSKFFEEYNPNRDEFRLIMEQILEYM